MTDNVREFNLALDRFIGEQVPELAVDLQQKYTLDALRGVVMKSPVDTGRFRANWHVSTTPSDLVTEDRDQQPRGTGPSGTQQAEATAVLATLQPYGTAYVQNGLPYAQRLESGSSKQAPGGMVALTLAELQASIAQELGE